MSVLRELLNRHSLLKRTAKALLRLPFRGVSLLQPRRIIVYYGWPDFARKAEAVADLLRRRGLKPLVRSGRSWIRCLQIHSSRDLWIGFWNVYRTDYMPANYIFFNGEQLDLPHWKEDEDWSRGMRDALEVWDFSQTNEKYVTRLGARFRYVPFGYAPYYERSYRDNTDGKGLVENIDVLFFGTLSARRRATIDRLRELGVGVHTVTRDNPLHGEKLDEMIARAKIVLSVFCYDDPGAQLADFARLDHLLANRRFVVHERPSDIGADQVFEQHVTTCRYDELADTCVYFLARPQERKRIADAAYEWFKAERSLDTFLPYDAIRDYFSRLA